MTRVHELYSLDCNFFAFEGSSEDLTISSISDEIAPINPHVTNIDSFIIAIIVLLNNDWWKRFFSCIIIPRIKSNYR